MNSLTSNLHFLLISFYRPTAQRYKIIMEAKAFPSDAFAFASQVQFHGFDPKDAIVELAPRQGETSLRTEDIVKCIRREGDQVAVVLFSGVQYYTGQFFDLKTIAEEGHAVGAMVGFDLAHAAGNVPLQLHDWNVDFAAWCTYKYLNSGPGNIGGLFVHSKHNHANLPRLAGWWGSDPATKFTMNNEFHGIPGAAGYRLSNPSVLAVTSLHASLLTFAKTSMPELREKSMQLTAYLEHLLLDLLASRPGAFRILTPSDPSARGCQLSVFFEGGRMETVFEGLLERGVVCDERRPDVIRMSPAPLYCTFEDCWKVVEALREVL
ncbi:Kynureninase (L-kynurenine hydrolase) [Podochytrium sp. JEL0797]|nr:Kynureninase (L-kynurenine hydrolase) [Podochytrium sp. JEL0797]